VTVYRTTNTKYSAGMLVAVEMLSELVKLYAHCCSVEHIWKFTHEHRRGGTPILIRIHLYMQDLLASH
jgi:hypothetical protein